MAAVEAVKITNIDPYGPLISDHMASVPAKMKGKLPVGSMC